MLSAIAEVYRPAPAIERLPQEQVPRRYTFLRWQVMLSIFSGYASYYIVRNNFSLAKPCST